MLYSPILYCHIGSEFLGSEQEEMREEQHEIDLKENYEADEKYEESKD